MAEKSSSKRKVCSCYPRPRCRCFNSQGIKNCTPLFSSSLPRSLFLLAPFCPFLSYPINPTFTIYYSSIHLADSPRVFFPFSVGPGPLSPQDRKKMPSPTYAHVPSAQLAGAQSQSNLNTTDTATKTIILTNLLYPSRLPAVHVPWSSTEVPLVFSVGVSCVVRKV